MSLIANLGEKFKVFENSLNKISYFKKAEFSKVNSKFYGFKGDIWNSYESKKSKGVVSDFVRIYNLEKYNFSIGFAFENFNSKENFLTSVNLKFKKDNKDIFYTQVFNYEQIKEILKKSIKDIDKFVLENPELQEDINSKTEKSFKRELERRENIIKKMFIQSFNLKDNIFEELSKDLDFDKKIKELEKSIEEKINEQNLINASFLDKEEKLKQKKEELEKKYKIKELERQLKTLKNKIENDLDVSFKHMEMGKLIDKYEENEKYIKEMKIEYQNLIIKFPKFISNQYLDNISEKTKNKHQPMRKRGK